MAVTASEGAILLCSSGRRVELWDLFEQAIQDVGVRWRVIGMDSGGCATGHARGPVFRVPLVGSSEFKAAVDEIVRRECVRLIVPTIDTELPVFAAGRFAAPAAISSPETVAIAHDKLETARFAVDCGIPVPETRLFSDAPLEVGTWVVKPRFGSSSVGLRLDVGRFDIGAIAEAAARVPHVAQRQLRGAEYTVNFFVERDGRCATAIPHRRLATRSGEVSHGLVVRHPRIEQLTRTLAERLPGAYGPLCAQFIDDEVTGVALIEVNARFGGGYPLAHRAGARFPQKLVCDAAGRPQAPAEPWDAGWEMFRYDQSVFVRSQVP